MSRPDSTHHHGPLAGLGAGAAAVLFAFAVLLLAWHRVAGQVSTGITVLVYVVIAAVCGLAVAALFYAVLWLRHRVRHPETLAGRRVVQAEVLEAAQPAAPGAPGLEAAQPLAIEPPRNEVHLHFHGLGPAEAAEAIRQASRE